MNSRALWPIGELIVGNQSFRIHVRLKGPTIRNSSDSPELEKNILQEHAELSRYYISSVFFFTLFVFPTVAVQSAKVTFPISNPALCDNS